MSEEKVDFKFGLGDEVKDSITGFKGIVTARTQWLHGCNVYRVQPQDLKDGKRLEVDHFDEPQLEVVEEEVHKEHRKTGGPAHEAVMTNR
jgi:hypothetical protein